MKCYKIKTTANGVALYFNNDYCFFTEKHATTYNGRKAACDGLVYAKKCASSQEILDNLEIVEL